MKSCLTVTCDKCGHVFTIGDWAFCPHDRGHAVAVHDDTLEGGSRMIDFGGVDHFVGSKSEWRRILAARPDLAHVDRHDASYYARHRRQHDEMLRDTGQK